MIANAITALRFAPEWEGVLGFDEFALKTVVLSDAPWGTVKEGVWSDHENTLTANWLQHEDIMASTDIAAEAVQAVARDRRFHPVREYLDRLKWDGVPRIDSWLIEYLGVHVADTSMPELTLDHELKQYVEAVGSRYLIQAVARIYRPGAKADCCLILEGPQGLRKSTALKTLGDPWFTDDISDLGTKDAAMQSHGVWIIEIAELDSMSRGDVGKIKGFMSRATDHYRPPYARETIDAQRQCVFAGSVNHSDYLRDETGGRRFWPVTCTRIDIESLARDRDQLWAEATARFKSGEPWWLDSEELSRTATEEQADRYDADPWHELISREINGKRETSVSDVLENVIKKKADAWTQGDKTRVARCLIVLGYTRTRTGSKASRSYRYCKKVDGE